jgi:ATP-GRASP peptide maturase of grasp-with-spasm system
MILINSEPNDVSTHGVADWLDRTGVDYHVLENEEIDLRSSEDGKCWITLDHGDSWVCIDELVGYWFRRGELNMSGSLIGNQPVPFREMVATNRMEDRAALIGFLVHRLRKQRSIDSQGRSNVNKLVVNDLARQCGLSVPPYIITSSKAELEEFMRRHGRVICKPYTPGFFDRGSGIRCLTHEVEAQFIASLDHPFAPTFIQKMVQKSYEIRSFHLMRDFHSIAIFSQKNDRTRTDFRNYDHVNPNRQVPYSLPEPIQRKLLDLISALGLDSCSIDMIQDIDGDLHFLEVNPVGQFGMVSYWANCHLERRIAHHLADLQHE